MLRAQAITPAVTACILSDSSEIRMRHTRAAVPSLAVTIRLLPGLKQELSTLPLCRIGSPIIFRVATSQTFTLSPHSVTAILPSGLKLARDTHSPCQSAAPSSLPFVKSQKNALPTPAMRTVEPSALKYALGTTR